MNYWNVDIRDIELLITTISFFITAFVGVIVFFQNRKSWTHVFFFLLSIIFDLYIVTNYFSLHPPAEIIVDRLFWIRLVMCIASFKTPLLFLFVHTFPEKNIRMKASQIFMVIISMFTAATLSISPFVFRSLNYNGNMPIPVPGVGMPAFLFNFFFFLILSVIILFKKYHSSIDIDRQKIRYLLFGIISSFSLFAMVSLIFVVIFQVAYFIFLAPLFLVFLIVPIGYSIIKHELFEIKTILANIFVFILWIILLARLVVSKSVIDSSINLIVFLLAMFFGILVINSVKKEINQRKENERLVKNLKEIDEIKSGLVSLARHHIANPLTALKGYVSILQEETNIDRNKILSDIDRITNNLITIIQDFLDVSRFEEGDINYSFSEVDFKKITEKILEEHKEIVEQRDIKLDFKYCENKEYIILADQEKLSRAISNIINNSIKHTKNGYIKVLLDIAENRILLDISDTGIRNLPSTPINLIKKFSSSGNKEEADIITNNLGLYFTRRIIEAHGGAFRIEIDKKYLNTKFYVELLLNN